RARARDAADRRVRGRAHGQPRFCNGHGHPHAAPRVSRRAVADDRDGHPRPARGPLRRPRAASRRRRDRARGDVPVMTTAALRGILGRKLRTALTAFAIVLGVAMVGGGYMLTDSISKAFDSIFASSYANTDAVISGRSLTDYSNAGRATVSPALL